MAQLEWRVPRSLDELPRLLFMDIHQMVIVLVLGGVGVVSGSMVYGLAAGAVVARVYGMFQTGRHPRFAVHLAYWYLPSWILYLRRTPSAHLRLFLG